MLALTWVKNLLSAWEVVYVSPIWAEVMLNTSTTSPDNIVSSGVITDALVRLYSEGSTKIPFINTLS